MTFQQRGRVFTNNSRDSSTFLQRFHYTSFVNLKVAQLLTEVGLLSNDSKQKKYGEQY